MTQRAWLTIPIEVKAREFESRLLLSQYAVTKGFGVIIGSSHQISRYLDVLPEGIYLDKSISRNKYSKLKRLVDSGYKLVSIDEEGLSSYNNRWLYEKQRISEETLELATKMFTWGNCETDVVLKKYPHFKEKVTPTGNPRVDLWRGPFRGIFGQKAEEYKRKYGS